VAEEELALRGFNATRVQALTRVEKLEGFKTFNAGAGSKG
jgi:hypothetical protein